MDIKTICVIVSTILSFCTFIGAAIGFCVIKFNDFKHIEKNQTEINDKLDKLLTISNDNTKDIAVINERCKTHKTIKD